MLQRILIVGLIVALPMVMLYPLWECPTSAGEDDVVYYYPLRVLTAGEIRAGRAPLWNPYEAGGVALLGDPQSAVYYPTNWLFLFLPAKLAYSLAVFLAFSTAGGGAYLYARRVGLGRAAGLFVCVVFMFCGFMVGHRVHLGLIQGAALLPWGLWAIERYRHGRRGLDLFVAVTAIVALIVASGHWPTAMQVSAVWIAYLLVRARPVFRAIGVTILAGATGGLLVLPQILAVVANFQQTVRTHVPFATAGENSFFPLSYVLAFFPFLMGCRTQNLFAQPWWGVWHLCEMLGYVGLVTITLAAGAIWRLYRRRVAPAVQASPTQAQPDQPHSPAEMAMLLGDTPVGAPDFSPLVKLWTWLLIVTGLWALGYYLPTFEVFHRLPGLDSIRCPARWLLVIDLGLAVLAGIALQSLLSHPRPELVKTLRRWVTFYLPGAMLLTLGVVYITGRWGADMLRDGGLLAWPPDGSDPAELWRQSTRLTSPAVFIPLALAALTLAAVRWMLGNPSRRVGVLVVLAIADLFFIARFVDVPGRGQVNPDPTDSPAARWLAKNATAPAPWTIAPASTSQPMTSSMPSGTVHENQRQYRVFGLAGSFTDRPTELLLPKACAAQGIETIAYYGPLGPASYASLLGFRPWGANESWEWLIRRNHLLSLFNVRYILAADDQFRQVIESVKIPESPIEPDGPDLLGADFWPQTRTIRAPHWYAKEEVRTPVKLEACQTYRISMDLRAPSGAGNLVTADCTSMDWAELPGSRLRVDIEQLNANWRHFECAFVVPAGHTGPSRFRLYTMSIDLIEVRNVTLKLSHLDEPVNLGGRLGPGERVYVDRTPEGLPPRQPGKPPVHIYENMLCMPREFPIERVEVLSDANAVVQTLRWRPEQYDLTKVALVDKASPNPVIAFRSENPLRIPGAERTFGPEPSPPRPGRPLISEPEHTFDPANGLGALVQYGRASGIRETLSHSEFQVCVYAQVFGGLVWIVLAAAVWLKARKRSRRLL